MCGRYTLDVPFAVLADLLSVPPVGDGSSVGWDPVYSTAPRTQAPIVREHVEGDDTVRGVELASWGLAPSWAKEGGPRPINARLETAATNGMFRSAFSSGRVLVPMSGYYEWQPGLDESTGKAVKNPWYIHDPDIPVLVAAGLSAARRNDMGQWTSSFTILTRTGLDAAGQVHDRMPVFLPSQAWEDWLDPSPLVDREAMTSRLEGWSTGCAAGLRTHRVDHAVNNTRTLDRCDPTLIAPLPEPG